MILFPSLIKNCIIFLIKLLPICSNYELWRLWSNNKTYLNKELPFLSNTLYEFFIIFMLLTEFVYWGVNQKFDFSFFSLFYVPDFWSFWSFLSYPNVSSFFFRTAKIAVISIKTNKMGIPIIRNNLRDFEIFY